MAVARTLCVLLALIWITIWAPAAIAAITLTGQDDALFRWSTASGPVVGYRVEVALNGAPYKLRSQVAEPEVRINVQFGERIAIRVAAFDAEGNLGPFSTPSETVTLELPPIQAAEAEARPADSDGDGEADLPLRHFRHSWLSSWTRDLEISVTNVALPAQDTGWIDAARGDLDGNGSIDQIWHREDSGWMIAVLTGDRPATRFVTEILSEGSRVVGAGDFDGDGRADLLVRNVDRGELAVWFMNGFAVRGIDSVAIDPGPLYSARGVADYDGDGHADILWRAPSVSRLDIWTMNGANLQLPLLLGDPLPPQWQVLASADFDLDGRADVLVHDRRDNGLAIWRRNRGFGIWGDWGLRPEASLDEYVPMSSQLVAVGDYSGDDRPDLLWYNSLADTLDVWRLDADRVVASWTIDGGFHKEFEPLWPAPLSNDPLGGLCPGDLDADGYVTSRDIEASRMCDLGRPHGQCVLADVNGDGIIGNADAAKMRQLSSNEPCS